VSYCEIVSSVFLVAGIHPVNDVDSKIIMFSYEHLWDTRRNQWQPRKVGQLDRICGVFVKIEVLTVKY